MFLLSNFDTLLIKNSTVYLIWLLAYRDDDGKPWILPVVQKCEKELPVNHEYLEILGDTTFSQAATAFLLGHDSDAIKQQRVKERQTKKG